VLGWGRPAGAGEPLLLVAGPALSHTGWAPMLDACTAHHRVIVFDHRATGTSEAGTGQPYGTRGFARDRRCRAGRGGLVEPLFTPGRATEHVPAVDSWHDDGMTRIRLSTTVDASLLEHARNVRSGTTDAALVDEALAALLARYRSAEVDASYAAYDEHPLDEPDEWGDLASFRRAAATS
jgi:hypothetical protein